MPTHVEPCEAQAVNLHCRFEALCIDFDDVFPFDYVEIFLFAVMKIPRWSAFLVITLLHYKQISSGFAYSNVVLLIKAVLARCFAIRARGGLGVTWIRVGCDGGSVLR